MLTLIRSRAFHNFCNLGVVALASTFGIQLLRLLMVGLVFYLREVREFTTTQVGGLAFLVFGSVFLAPAVVRVLGVGKTFTASVVIVALARSTEQFVDSPPLDLALAVVGIVAFLPLLSLFSLKQDKGIRALGRKQSILGRRQLCLGLLLGLAFDTAIKGGFHTLDTSWHPSLWADVVTVALAVCLLAFLSFSRQTAPGQQDIVVGSQGLLPFLAVGPFLFLEMLLFQNIGQQTALIGWSQPAVSASIIATNVFSLLLAVYFVGGDRRIGDRRLLPKASRPTTTPASTGNRKLLSTLAAGVLTSVSAVVLAFVVVTEWSGLRAAVLLFVGHLAATILFVVPWRMATPIKSAQNEGQPAHNGVGTADDHTVQGKSDRNKGQPVLGIIFLGGLGMLFFMCLTFAYYARYDLDLGISRAAVIWFAVALMAIPALLSGSREYRSEASESESGEERQKSRDRTFLFACAPGLGATLLLIPLVLWGRWAQPPVVDVVEMPLRVMSYNIHQGFGTSGALDLEAIAEVIEAESVDVVALQEISRGWLISGSVDTLIWLSQRLDMPYVWGPTADSVWGNAILSRYPLVDVEYHEMPNNSDLTLKRGFIRAEINVDSQDAEQDAERIRLIATHLHSYSAEGRIPQVQAILERWNGQERTILLGDLNGQPEDTEIVALAEAGLKDAYDDSGASGSSYTYHTRNLNERIDYVWVSSDLIATDYSVRSSQASDHLPVAVTVDFVE